MTDEFWEILPPALIGALDHHIAPDNFAWRRLVFWCFVIRWCCFVFYFFIVLLLLVMHLVICSSLLWWIWALNLSGKQKKLVSSIKGARNFCLRWPRANRFQMFYGHFYTNHLHKLVIIFKFFNIKVTMFS